MVREALANGYKHAGAQGQSVTVVQDDTSIIVSVSDTGPGISEIPQVEGGMGIAGMQYRMQSVGGKMDIRTRPTGGTEVIFAFPLAT